MRLLGILTCALLLLSAALVFNAVRLPASQAPGPAVELASVDADAAAARLAGALRIPTVTVNEVERIDWAPWPRLHDYLAASYPEIGRASCRERV